MQRLDCDSDFLCVCCGLMNCEYLNGIVVTGSSVEYLSNVRAELYYISERDAFNQKIIGTVIIVHMIIIYDRYQIILAVLLLRQSLMSSGYILFEPIYGVSEHA